MIRNGMSADASGIAPRSASVRLNTQQLVVTTTAMPVDLFVKQLPEFRSRSYLININADLLIQSNNATCLSLCK